MLIGLNGRMQSGKDAVGSYLQYLLSEDSKRMSYSSWQLQIERWYNQNDWQIKKFADKLKDIVCILIGCTRADLEDNDFKSKELGEEWTRYYLMNSYGSSMSVEVPDIEGDYGKEDFFTTDIKGSKEEWKEYLEKIKDDPIKMMGGQFIRSNKLTPRKLLQLLGTEAGRQIIHPNLWCNALMKDYKPNGTPYNSLGDLYDDLKHCPSETKFPNWIITDCRFPNEFKAIEDRGGVMIRVERTNFQDGSDYAWGNESSNHESETALDSYKFHFTILNNGTLQDLYKSVDSIIHLIKKRL